MPITKIILKSGKEQSLLRFHPWVFSGAIKSIEGKPQEGDIVEVYSNKDEFLAKGHYQIGSIAVRAVTFLQEETDYNFWKSKIFRAYQMRESLGLINNINTTVYRLIHGEGDNMPGLIVDIYSDTAVMQSHSVGMFKIREQLAKAIVEIFKGKITAVYDKSEGTLPFKAKLDPKNGYLLGSANDIQPVVEYGNKFIVDWIEGQKTGFFVDQRENRKLVEFYSKNKSVLNVFGYTGGFSVYAIRGGANLVHSVDSSERATELTNQNVSLNFPEANHEAFAVDAFEYLNTIDGKYDLIILDPPAFAKHQDALRNALQGYKKLNAKAIARIKPGGILFTFSCSQVVNKNNFREAVFSAAAIAKRQVRILHQLSQPPDHPVNIYHPEGEYLKGLVVYVE
jgi:23S rRNA (cytosine1962-C5)-methyltransferase